MQYINAPAVEVALGECDVTYVEPTIAHSGHSYPEGSCMVTFVRDRAAVLRHQIMLLEACGISVPEAARSNALDVWWNQAEELLHKAGKLVEAKQISIDLNDMPASAVWKAMGKVFPRWLYAR